MDIQLYVYDLSQGLARQASRQFLGVQIDAVYHTSLVFGGIEYFFGRGIQTAYPGSTHHGNPMEILKLGQTSLPEDLIQDYLESMKEIYSPESYDLFAHNCNNFTNDLAMFLLGRGIPDHITSLPKTVLDTPFGQMLRPQLDLAMRPVTQAPSALPPAAARSARAPVSNGITQNGSSKLNAVQDRIGKVQNVSSAEQFDSLLNEARTSCAVVFFTSASCGPCRMLYPIYDELAAEAGSKATLIKVDVSSIRDIGMRYSIGATPTFITFLKGKQLDRWTGSDAAQLRGNFNAMLQHYPPHPHQSLKLKYLPRLGNAKPVTYSKTPPLKKLTDKMGDQGQAKIVQECATFISGRGDGKNAQSVTVPDLPALSAFLLQSLHSMPLETLFTIYDLFRVLLVDPRISGYFLAETSLKTVHTLLSHVIDMQDSTVPYNLNLCAIHLACNLFTSRLTSDALTHPRSDSSGIKDPLGHLFWMLIERGLLDETHPALSVAASSLAFNMAKLANTERLSTFDDTGTAAPLASESTFVDITAPLIETFVKALSSSPESAETNAEAAAAALRYQAVALANLLYLAPLDGDLITLCDVLDAQATISKLAEKSATTPRTQKTESEAEQTTGLLKEINLMLDKRLRLE